MIKLYTHCQSESDPKNTFENTIELEIIVFGKYVVGRQIFVDRHLVDRLLSKNFRRHDTSSTQHFVDTTLRRKDGGT
jgi:hypothetical protein